MDLYQLITQAVGGFSVGLGASLNYKRYNEAVNSMEYAKLIDESRLGKELESKGLTEEKLKNWHEANRRLNILSPYLYGFGFSVATSIASFAQWNFGENVLISVPSAYLGFAAGVLTHRIKNMKFREEMQIAQEMKRNPDSIEALLTENERSTIRTSLEQIEQGMFEGSFNPLTSKPLFLIYSTVIERNKVYTPLVTQWSLKEIEKAISSGKLQKDLKDFYETPLPIGGSIATASLNSLVIERPTRVFVREGDKFYSLDVSWKNIRIIEQDETKEVSICGTAPDLRKIQEESWNPDYKTLAHIVEEHGKDANRVIMLAPENTSLGLQGAILTQNYVEELVRRLKNEKKN
ncbi:MAG: hypothetical protein Q8Q31_00475 [Nanoarchaeota archaeon]|nr:hypothetical protein [Nanoarchaeota archaeon]